MHKLTARTYVNADSTKIVDEGAADAAFLLGNEGDEISSETAIRLGLVSTGASYGDMKVADLRELAEKRGVEVDSDAKKADLVEALEAADAVGTGGTADAGSPADA